ncbi:uncharacterized protein LOC133037007 [Cannabis sativa]|uniref:uncharacterized protein LOC133037007 n=1 Tax=Cannabis sativa TaxID=3483 RepID=UPI0029C9E1CA|nr:uncharacterized protein LOC133037007 [Cannabis sativa]
MSQQEDFELAPIDPEIERTFRRRKRVQKAKGRDIMAENLDDDGIAQQIVNPIILADDRVRAIREYAAPMFNELNPRIVRPEIQAPQFELKPVMFQMLQTVGQFSGMPTEDPHLHLHRARSWLKTLPPDSVTNWNDLAEKFMRKYFPPTRNAKFRSEIMSFQQLEDESTSDAWERFKELLRKCPHHGIPHCIQMETFYNGLNAASRMVLDASTNGAILSKSYNEAFEIFETIASNNYQWSNTRAPTSRKVAGVLEVDAITALTAQMASMTNVLKNSSIENAKNIQPAATIQSGDVSCVFYGEGHVFEKCPSNPESVCYMGNQNFYRNNGAFSNSYNQAWKNHPNLSSGGGGIKEQAQAPHQPKKDKHIHRVFHNNRDIHNMLKILNRVLWRV